MFRLVVKYGDPIYIEFDGKVMAVYAHAKPISKTEYFASFHGPKDFLIIRIGAKCDWPRKENTIYNTPTGAK